jgi:hypothetical protein
VCEFVSMNVWVRVVDECVTLCDEYWGPGLLAHPPVLPHSASGWQPLPRLGCSSVLVSSASRV